MVEGIPYGLGGWGVPAVFREAGRLLGKYFTFIAPFIFAFVLPTAVIQLLEVFGLAWWASGQDPPFLQKHRHVLSKAIAGVDGSYPATPAWESEFFILLGVGILMWLLASLAIASICKTVQYIYSEEEDPSATKSIFMSLPQAILRLLVTSIWILCLTLVTIFTVSLPFYLLSVIFKEKHEALFETVNQIFIYIAVTILSFLFLLSQEVAVLEPNNYGLAALKRSSKLVQANILPALAVFAVSLVVGGSLSKLSSYIASLHGAGKVPQWAVYILAILFALLYLTYVAYIYLATVVLYFSSKVKHDAAEGTLPGFRHGGSGNPYAPLVVSAEN
ncbi:hypothetical protein M758_11G020300 [Ceratodon purpureus]|nr:hypothetical protein M758_11G020300 [Ceratodon purpureus]